jgi:hypothetical protein
MKTTVARYLDNDITTLDGSYISTLIKPTQVFVNGVIAYDPAEARADGISKRVVSVKFRYNPGGQTETSGDDTITLYAYIYYNGVLQDELLQIKNRTNQWIDFDSGLLFVPSDFRVVFRIVNGKHVPDTGIDDVIITVNGIEYVFNFNDINNFSSWRMHLTTTAPFSKSALSPPANPFFVNAENGINGPFTMVTNPGSSYLKYDGLAHINTGPGHVNYNRNSYLASPVFTLTTIVPGDCV